MKQMSDVYQSADWKNEKHVPVIDAPARVDADSLFEVNVAIGKEIAHPNTTAHHIRWIQLFFLPEGGKFPYEVGNYEFTAHGESTEGADTGPVYTDHSVTARLKIAGSGTLIATSLCNIHGLWENSVEVKVA